MSPFRWMRTLLVLHAALIGPLTPLAGWAGDAARAGPAPATQVPVNAQPGRSPKLVDINSASPAELKALPGIGDAEAARIVARRPYLSKAMLVEKGALSADVFLALRSHVEAIQKSRPVKLKAAGRAASDPAPRTTGKP
jgi:competence protein ComEA